MPALAEGGTGRVITGVTQEGVADQVVATGMTRSPDERPEAVRTVSFNQSDCVLQLVLEAAETYAASYGEQQVPAEGLPGENLDVTA